MNKKEIAEVKKTLKVGNSCIDKVCACYVTPSKEKTMIPIGNFAALDEDEMVKYLEIFKKAISGSVGKQLLCLPFPNDAEEDGNGQNLLYELEKSALGDDERVEDLFDRIIENYVSEDYYCIILMHANYDVVSKATDDTDLDSEDVYSHLICAVCPVALTKAFLAYNQSKNHLESSTRNWEIGNPHTAFLFPTFTDRMSNIHEVLVYNKKSSELNEGIIEGVLNCKIPMSADEQQAAFLESTQSAFSNTVTFDQAMDIHNAIVEKIEDADDSNLLPMSKEDLKKIIEDTDSNTDTDAFAEKFDEMMNGQEVFAENLVNKDKITIKMDGVTITLTATTKDLISMQDVNGQKCLVIAPNGDMEVDGIVAKIF